MSNDMVEDYGILLLEDNITKEELLNYPYLIQKTGKDGRITADAHIDNSLHRIYMRGNFALKQIALKGGRVWLNEDGKYILQISADAEIIEGMSQKAFSEKIYAMYGILLADDIERKEIIIGMEPLFACDLKTVTKYGYEPTQRLLFLKDPENKNRFIYNTHRLSNLQLGSFYDAGLGSPVLMQNLYIDLTGNETDGAKFLDDTMCRFHQTAITGDKHIVFNTYDTTAVDIWFESSLTHMYGKHNVVKIEDDELGKEFLSQTIEKQIVYIKDIPSDADKEVRKRLAELIKTKSKYTMIIFATNNLELLGIHKNREDFTIFSPNNITENYLGEVSYSGLGKALECSIPEYINYSYFHDVDKKLIENFLPTVTKDEVLSVPLNKVDLFISNLLIYNITYFKRLNNTAYTALYTALREDFYRGSISKASLAPLYNAMEDTEYSAKAFLLKLRASSKLNKKFFDKKNAKQVESGDELFIINSEFNEFYKDEVVDEIA